MYGPRVLVPQSIIEIDARKRAAQTLKFEQDYVVRKPVGQIIFTAYGFN